MGNLSHVGHLIFLKWFSNQWSSHVYRDLLINPHIFHLLKNMFHFPLLVLKGNNFTVGHISSFFQGANTQMEDIHIHLLGIGIGCLKWLGVPRNFVGVLCPNAKRGSQHFETHIHRRIKEMPRLLESISVSNQPDGFRRLPTIQARVGPETFVGTAFSKSLAQGSGHRPVSISMQNPPSL